MLALTCAKLSTFLYGFTRVGREPQAHRFLSFSRSLSPLPPSVSTSALRQLHDLVVVLLERGAVADGDEGRAPLAPAPAQQLRAAYNVGFLDHAYALCAQDASLAATNITSRLFIHVAAAAYRGGVVQWLHARDTPLIAADNDEWQQWRSKAAAGAISDHKTSRVWVQPAASIFNPTVSNPPSASKSSITVLVKLTRSGTDSPSTEAALFPSLLPPPAVPAVVASTLKPESLG